MAAQNKPFDEWPEHVKVVLVAIGQVMGTRQDLHPNYLEAIPSEFGSILPNHSVKVLHFKKGAREVGELSHYKIEIRGPRYDGDWKFRPGELARVAKQAVASS